MKTFLKTIFRLTFIIALQNCIVYGVGLADTVMLGNYDELSLSGAAVSNQIQFFLQLIAAGAGEGVVVLCSQYWGKREIKPIQSIISAGLKIGVAMSFVLMIFVYFNPETALSIFTDKKDVITEGAKYLKIVSLSYVFFMVAQILIASLRSVEIVKLGLVVAVTALVTNVGLNYILIYGNFGAPEKGIEGAAIATLISRIIEFSIVVFYVFVIDKRINFKIKHLFKHNKQLLGDYLRAGIPIIISGAMWGVGNGAQLAILGRLESESVIAANVVAATVFQIITVVAYGAASASGVVIGKTIGAGAGIDTIKKYSKVLQMIFLGLGLVTSAALFLSRDFVIAIHNDITPESKELARQFITILSVTVIGTAYQMAVLTGIVRGGGDTKFVLINDTIFIWLIVIPSAAIAAFVLNLSPIIVFICLKSDQILKCAVAAVHVNRYKWIKKLTR